MTHSSRLRRFVGLSSRFLTIGAISTLIEIVVFNLFFYAFEVDGAWSKVLASTVALINAYFGNRQWAFKGRGKHRKTTELILFLLVNGICTALGAVIVWGGLALLPVVGPLLVNLVNLVSIATVVVIRFLLYSYVVFRGVRHSPTSTLLRR